MVFFSFLYAFVFLVQFFVDVLEWIVIIWPGLLTAVFNAVFTAVCSAVFVVFVVFVFLALLLFDAGRIPTIDSGILVTPAFLVIYADIMFVWLIWLFWLTRILNDRDRDRYVWLNHR